MDTSMKLDGPRLDLVEIGAVARETGIRLATLRVWERRYGFPAPVRDTRGRRLYSRQQVDQLRALKRHVDNGYRPGKLIEALHHSYREGAVRPEVAIDSPVRAADAALSRKVDANTHR